jgi:hypothetical protein
MISLKGITLTKITFYNEKKLKYFPKLDKNSIFSLYDKEKDRSDLIGMVTFVNMSVNDALHDEGSQSWRRSRAS